MNKLLVIGLILCLIAPAVMATEVQEKMRIRRIQFIGTGVAVFIVPNESGETLTSIEQVQIVIGSFPEQVKVYTTIDSTGIQVQKTVREFINTKRLGLLKLGVGEEKQIYVMKAVSVESKKIAAELYAHTTVLINDEETVSSAGLTKLGELEIIKTDIEVPASGGRKDTLARWDGNMTIDGKTYKLYIPVRKTFTTQELSAVAHTNCSNNPDSVSCKKLALRATNTTIEAYCLANASDVYCQRAQVEYCLRKHKLTASNVDIETADPRCYAVIQQWCGTAKSVVANALCIMEQDGTEETYAVDAVNVPSAVTTISETEEREDLEMAGTAGNTVDSAGGNNSPSPLNEGVQGAN